MRSVIPYTVSGLPAVPGRQDPNNAGMTVHTDALSVVFHRDGLSLRPQTPSDEQISPYALSPNSPELAGTVSVRRRQVCLFPTSTLNVL